VIRAVLDSNTLIAALLIRHRLPWRILAAAYASVFLCFSSDAIVREVFTALGSRRVRGRYPVDPVEIEQLRRFLMSDPVRVPITVTVQGVAAHPQDDLILATAVSAQADYLVTGDRELLALGRYQDVQIVTPREFATILGLPAAVQ
jgi:uncharacterized protein